MTRALRTGAALCVALAASLALSAGITLADSAAPRASGTSAGPDCLRVEAGEDLQARIEAAPEDARLCLAPGEFEGPLRLARRIRIEGPAEAIIRARGQGTTVLLEGRGAELHGVTIDGSGGRHDLLDAAIRVRADEVTVQGVTVRNALFGVLVEKSRGVVLRDNTIVGSPEKTFGMRGDGIRIWEVRDSTIQGNRLLDSRDLVIWYSPGNHITHNVVERGRYGTHFMYSHDNLVEHNRYVGNVVGVFAMYSRDLRVRNNIFARSTGSAGVGLGAKESGPLEVSDNLFVSNTVGAYLDSSPLDLTDHNRFERNDFRLNETAVIFHSTVERNSFVDNRFRDNQTQIRVEGRGDALAAIWRRNDFDDYAGYDLDGDGLGDVPYELRSLSEQLINRHPQLAFFRGSPAMSIVEMIGRVVPLFRARVLLIDPEPRMHWLATEEPLEG